MTTSTEAVEQLRLASGLAPEARRGHAALGQKGLYRSDKLSGRRDFHDGLHTSANADFASPKCKQSLPSQYHIVLASADKVTEQPSLYEQLQAIKPDGLSNNAWTARAGVSRMALTDIKRRGEAQRGTITKLLSAIGATFADLEAGARAPHKEPSTPEAASPMMAFRADDRPRDVPVVGTADCAEMEFGLDGDARVAIETMEMDLDEIVDRIRRPVTMDKRRDIYAIYFRGHSMSPRFEPGELAYVDPKRPPTIMDYVVVQLRRQDGDGERIFVAMAKRLLRQSSSFIELEQFNPPARFRVERSQVAHIHRIVPWDEVVGF